MRAVLRVFAVLAHGAADEGTQPVEFPVMGTAPRKEFGARVEWILRQRVSVGLRGEVLERRPEQVVLALEVAEERHFVHAGGLGDAPRRRAAPAGVGEHLDGGLEQGLAHAHLSTLADATGCVQVITCMCGARAGGAPAALDAVFRYGVPVSDAPAGRRRPSPHAVTVGDRVFPVDLARHPRARRYVLRVSPDGRLRLTVPRGASIGGGLSFAAREEAWITREWARLQQGAAAWHHGSGVWYRGVRVALTLTAGAAVFADQRVRLGSASGVRASVERHLRALASRELPERTVALARQHGISIERVSVRDQRSRWGSCSPRGAIALNWRLVQMPHEVAEYVILHELAHRLHANHSRRFWRAVERICPGWRTAERWLRTHGRELF